MSGNLVIRLRGMGDIVHMIPALKVLRQNLGAENITFLCQKPFGELIPPSLNITILEIENRASFMHTLALVRKIRQHRFDRLFDFFGNPRTALISFLSRIPWRVGFDYRVRRFAYHKVFHPQDSNRYLPELFGEFLHFFNFGGSIERSELELEKSALLRASEFLAKQGTVKPLLGINPHSTYQSKAWPTSHVENFVKLWYSKTRQRVLIFWGPKEKLAAVRLFDSLGSSMVFLHPELSIRELIALISKLDIFLTADSGPMNLAWVLKVPTVALFGPTTQRAVAPRGHEHLVLSHPQLQCLGCHRETCEDARCMSEMTAEWVFTRIFEKYSNRFFKNGI